MKYTIVVDPLGKIEGDAVGVFHIENGQMVEYWLLERDQKMINDIIAMSGKPLLAGAGKLKVTLGVLLHPIALVRTILRIKRPSKKML